MSNTRTIDKIDDNEHFEYKGNINITGSIGKNATVIIKDGSLTVDGSVGNDTTISLTTTQSSNIVVSSGIFFSGNIVSIGGATSSKDALIHGNLGNNVTFNSHNASLNVEGNIGTGSRIKTHNGDIAAGNVGEQTSLLTHNGDINVGNVGKKASLITHNGEVHAGILDQNTTASTHNGDVRVTRADASTNLTSHNGSVYENGIKRRKEATQQGSISINGLSVFSSGGGRVIVNGQDITRLLQQQAIIASKSDAKEEPVRYFKRG